MKRTRVLGGTLAAIALLAATLAATAPGPPHGPAPSVPQARVAGAA